MLSLLTLISLATAAVVLSRKMQSLNEGRTEARIPVEIQQRIDRRSH